jgi:HicB family
MQLDEYVDRLRTEFAAAADAAGDDARAVAERLVVPLESAVRLTLLEALSAAADAITLELAPGSVHVRLRGRDPDFVVTPTPAPAEAAPAGDPPPSPSPDAGPAGRVNFRPPEALKARIEEAAQREGLSTNTWLVRAATAALDPRPTRSDRTGWFG